MGRRMLCTRCERTAAPDTLVAGSDLVELVLWGLLAVPGLVYCAWRHAHRRRICPHCGSSALMRESRASRLRQQLVPAAPQPAAVEAPRGDLVYAARRIPWMATPTQRLRRITRGSAVAAAGMVAWAVIWVNTVQVQPSPEAAREARLAAAAGRKAPDPEVAREARRQNRRLAECERLCAELHLVGAPGHRRCMDSCASRLDEALDRDGGARSACADLLDASTCEFVAGRGGEEPPVAGSPLPTPGALTEPPATR